MTICGTLSCFGTSFVILFYWFNPSLQKNIYNTVIYYIAISDFFSALGGSFGYVHEGTSICTIQAILTNIFPLSSVFWVTILIYIYLQLLTSHESINLIYYTTHIFCWGFPVLLTFLPLTTNKFGIFNGDTGWCWLDERSNTPSWASFFWNLISFYLWIWLAIGVYLLFYFYILYEIKTRYETFSSSENILRTLHKISLYPLSVVSCWLVPCLYDQLDYFQNQNSSTNTLIFDELSSITPLLQGLFTCIIFVSTNSEMVSTSFHEVIKKYCPSCLTSIQDQNNLLDPNQSETSAQLSSSRISSVRLQRYHSSHAGPPGEIHRTEMTSPLAYRPQS